MLIPWFYSVVSEILRRVFGSKRVANGEWRRLHNEELHNLYFSPNTVRVLKFRRLRWAGHVAKVEEGMSAFKILTGTTTGKLLSASQLQESS